MKHKKPEEIIGYDEYGDPLYEDYDYAEDMKNILAAPKDTDKVIVYSAKLIENLPDQSASHVTLTFKATDAQLDELANRVLKQNGTISFDAEAQPLKHRKKIRPHGTF